MSDSLQSHGLYSPWNSPGQNTEVGSLSLLQRIFPTQGSKPSLLHCRRILYPLSHKGSPKIQESVAYLFSSGSSRPRNWTRVSCIAGGFFTNWAIMASGVTAQIRADMDNSGGTNGKESACQCRRYNRHRLHLWTRKTAWRRKWQPTPVFLPGESRGQRSLAGYSPWGHKESETIDHTAQQQKGN